MQERGKFFSSAAIATALAISDENQVNTGGEAIELPSPSPSPSYACNPDNLYAVPRIDSHEIEWLEADSLDADIPRFVTTKNNRRKCCRTSISSGYSSHSPPLSAGSYSCYASVVPGQTFYRGLPFTMKDQFLTTGGLAVIHETESIPRPIWPTSYFPFTAPRELCHADENTEYDTLYACCGCCGCAYSYSYCDWDLEKSLSVGTSTHDILLELSRTLNAVIEEKNAMTSDQILQKLKRAPAPPPLPALYEYVYHNSSLLSTKRSFLTDKNPSCLSNSNKNSSNINPVNSKLYNNARQYYLHNPLHTCLCACEHTRRHRPLSSKSDEQTETSYESEKKENSSVVLLMDDHCQECQETNMLKDNEGTLEDNKNLHESRASRRTKIQIAYTNRRSIKAGFEETCACRLDEGTNQSRNKIIQNEKDYAMQLECQEGDSLNKGTIFSSSSKNDWDYRSHGFSRDLDFTLDVSRAERLGRAIAKAKRKRHWCRTLTAFFGLVFFVLSVVIVSLSVTRGRKVFGSM